MFFLFSERLLNGIQQMKQILAMKWQKPPGEDAEEINQQVEKIAKQATSKYSRTFFRISALFAKFFRVNSNICYTSIICNTLHPYQCSQCYLVFFIKKTCVTLLKSVKTVFSTTYKRQLFHYVSHLFSYTKQSPISRKTCSTYHQS